MSASSQAAAAERDGKSSEKKGEIGMAINYYLDAGRLYQKAVDEMKANVQRVEAMRGNHPPGGAAPTALNPASLKRAFGAKK